MTRIRVMYVVPNLRMGGAERHVTKLMPNLDPERFETAVVCIGEEGALFGDLAGSGTRAVALNRTKRQGFLALRDLVREMRSFAPDVVITRDYNAETLGRIAAFLTGVPHNVVRIANDGETGRRGAVRRIADRVLDRVTSAYFGLTNAQMDYLVHDLKYPRAKIRITPNGVEPERFQSTDDRSAVADLGIGETDKVVGILAMLRPEKDHATFVRAARLVADRVPEAKFLIAGEGPMRPEIEKLVDELDLRDRVVLAGARSDVPEILRAMDVFVLTSYTIECFPNALLEAMAAGRPAVCTAVGGVREIMDAPRTGYVVPQRNPVALADRLVQILTDEDLAKRMGRAARARVEDQFSLRASVATAARALEDLVGGRQRLDRPIQLSAVLDLTTVGGVEVLLLNLFKHFDPRVVVPRLVCLKEAGPLAGEFLAAGFDVEVLDRTGRYDMRTLPRLIRSFRAAKTDAVLVTHHQLASLAFGRIAARLAGVPANIVAAHSMDRVSVGRRVLPSWAVNTLALSDALVLVSAGQGAYLRREEGVSHSFGATTREVVIANGIELPPVPTTEDRSRARTALGVADTDFVVGIVARLGPEKAHEVLFRAVAACVPSVPEIRLVVIGDGPRDAELKELATELGIAARTTFLGTRRDVPDLLPGLDVKCLSSKYEAVPITLIEAMAACLPVVATNCGSVGEIVEDGAQGFVVSVGDVDGFADRLRQLAGQQSLRTQMGKSGRARVECGFDIEDTARGYEELLTDIVMRKAR